MRSNAEGAALEPAGARSEPKTAVSADAGSPNGLTSDDARSRLEKSGPNAMPDTSEHPWVAALGNFWAPVPWMLEAAILLELLLGRYVEAAIIASLLGFNAALGLFQESRAQATLAALKSRLALNASVRRDGRWKTIPAAELVPGDVVKLSLGGVVAADVRIAAGEVLLDQSMLTGESAPIEAGAGVQTFAGALVHRGEAVAEVTATGARTKFGRTAELVRTAHVVSSQQKAVLRCRLCGRRHGVPDRLRDGACLPRAVDRLIASEAATAPSRGAGTWRAVARLSPFERDNGSRWGEEPSVFSDAGARG